MPLPEPPAQIDVFEPGSARLLATGRECGDCADRQHAFSCLRGNGTLLIYYFGKGKRDVLVRQGPNEGVAAHLGTRWNRGHREWTLDW